MRLMRNGAQRLKVAASGLALAAVVGACAVPVPEPPPAPPPQLPVEAAPVESKPAYDEDALRALLDAAERALADDRLLSPEDDNAVAYYQEAAALAPGHEMVAEGLERVVERYLALAAQAIERERWASARSMLDRARIVDGDHSGIAPLRRQVELLAAARREVLELVHSEVRGRQAGVAAELETLGSAARQPNARVTIRAGSDADGRWIYEQLNKAPGTRRIRAGLSLGVPPRVTVLFLPEG